MTLNSSCGGHKQEGAVVFMSCPWASQRHLADYCRKQDVGLDESFVRPKRVLM